MTVLTVRPHAAADAIKKALQMGAAKGVHDNDDAIHGSDAIATSLVLAKAIRKLGGVDLVITGMASTDGTMGIMAAKKKPVEQWTLAAFPRRAQVRLTAAAASAGNRRDCHG